MKQCLKCLQTYSDDSLNFCLNDGEMLVVFQQEPGSPRFDDSPPTMILDQSRATNPTNWPGTASPPATWQAQQNLQDRPFGAMGTYQPKRDQTLPIIALVLGILSLTVVCCYGGFWLGLPAAIIGFLGMRNADNDPGRYMGRGMAIAGMVLGVISFLSSIVFLFIVIASNS